ncbi:hypothetical protein THRCLA_03331 [Thraustotheca clavata]|uniref:Methyltransferase FkbM domain-containing protein n=1 Tax=Thraustotheca clavata TaxID=74557 RepID=A0A1W0A2D1_9STRA|nr:hypothetical protein THRCLA_03331 [Thraustotheca clavata]
MPVCRRYPPAKCKVNDWLIRDSFNVTSQGGEDGVLERIFKILNEYEGRESSEGRWCVEFGAWDGKHLSNTWKLLHQEKWHGVLIEATKERFDEMQSMYASFPRVTCLNQFVTFDSDDSLEAILKRTNVPIDLDLISIDIDGADYHIWDSLKQYAPKVVVIEFNPTIPNNVVYIQDKDMSIYQGSSLAALIELGKAKGYELVSTTTFNGIFVLKELYPLFHIEDNSIDKMHDVTMPTEFFQLYDGTLKITGVKKLLWKKQPIHEKDIQIFSAAQRRFPLMPPPQQLEEALANAKARFDSATEADAPHFVQLSKEWSGHFTYPNPDVQRLAGYALDLAKDNREIVANVLQIYLDHAQEQFSMNEPGSAIPWLEEALYLPVNHGELKAIVMTTLGEAFIRTHEYNKAAFWLQTSNMLDPKSKATLKQNSTLSKAT